MPHDDIIAQVAKDLRLDPDLISALMMQETVGDCWRPRYEPAFKSLWHPDEWASQRRISRATEEVMQMMSWGPLQIMGATARWMGFDGDLPELCQPALGILYAAKYVRWLADKFGDDEPRIIAAYNAGPGVKKTPGGLYPNSKNYVDPVSQLLRDYRKLKA